MMKEQYAITQSAVYLINISTCIVNKSTTDPISLKTLNGL